MLQRAYDVALGEKSRRALDNLSAIYRLLKAYDVAQYVRFDLGIIRDFSYYTGMVFEGYTAGLGYPLVGGGRYDHLLSDFGNACPATGFALGIERIMLALEAAGAKAPTAVKDVYLAYVPGRTEAAIERSRVLRDEGHSVEVALKPQTEGEAQASCEAKGYSKLVYVK